MVIAIIPLYKNNVISGETIIVVIIPEGEKNPKSLMQTGAVKIFADNEEQRLLHTKSGTPLFKSILK